LHERIETTLARRHSINFVLVQRAAAERCTAAA